MVPDFNVIVAFVVFCFVLLAALTIQDAVSNGLGPEKQLGENKIEGSMSFKPTKKMNPKEVPVGYFERPVLFNTHVATAFDSSKKQFLNCPNADGGLNSPSGTFLCYFRADQPGLDSVISSRVGETKDGFFTGWVFRCLENGTLSLEVVDGTKGTKYEKTSIASLKPQEWNQVGFSFDRGDCKIYVNGEELPSFLNAESDTGIKVLKTPGREAPMQINAYSGIDQNDISVAYLSYWNRAIPKSIMPSLYPGEVPAEIKVDSIGLEPIYRNSLISMWNNGEHPVIYDTIGSNNCEMIKMSPMNFVDIAKTEYVNLSSIK